MISSNQAFADKMIRNAFLHNVNFKAETVYPTAYLGPVATRGRLNDFYSNSVSVAYMQSRTFHVATDDISAAELMFTGLYINATNENGVFAIGDVSASIEYPAGTFNQVTWSGITSGHINNNLLLSDMITLSVPIPTGATFWVRSLVHWTSGNKPYSTDGQHWQYSASTGEAAEWSATAPTDKTMSGTIGISTFHAAIYRPVAILGMTRKSTFYFAGDSRTRASGSGGNNDITGGFPGTLGELERSIAAKGFGYINGAVIGDSYYNASQSGAYIKRGQLASYCSIIIDNYGINDLGAGAAVISTAQFNNYIGKMKTVTGINGKLYYHTTLTPRASSTDYWSTTTSQTASASTASRIGFNDALRAGTISNVDGYIEVADANESSRDSGVWRADQGRILTSDITTTSGSQTVVSAGGNFTSNDTGRPLTVIGGGTYYIKSVTDLSHVVIQAAPSTSVSHATAYIGFATVDGLHNQIDGDMNIVNSHAFDIFDSLL